MKILIIILNITSGLIALGWIGWIFLSAFGAGMASTGGKGGSNFSFYLAILLIISTIICIALSHVGNIKHPLLFSLLPIILFVVLYITVSIHEDILKDKYRKVSKDTFEEYQTLVDTKLANVKEVYVKDPDTLKSSDIRKQFITFDQTNYVLVEIRVVTQADYKLGIEAIPIGKVDGKKLFSFSEYIAKKDESYLARLYDKDGKTIYDHYTVVYKPDQNMENYHLEKYKIN